MNDRFDLLPVVASSLSIGPDRMARLLRRSVVAVSATVLLCFLGVYAGFFVHGEATGKKSDFVAYYSAARLMASGHADSMYVPVQFGREEQRVIRPLRPRSGGLPYYAPPFLAMALSPLGRLPYIPAFLIWFVVNCILLSLAVGVLVSYRPVSRLSDKLSVFLVVASSLPVLVALAQGQVSLLMLAAIAIVLWLLDRNRPFWAGGVLALGAIKPQFVIPMILVLAIQRRWHAVGSFVAVFGMLSLAPLLVRAPETNLVYAHVLYKAVLHHEHVGGFEPQWNHGLDAFIRLLIQGEAGTALALMAGIAVLTVLVLVARRTDRADIGLGLGLVAGLLLSPHVLIHDLVLAIPAAFVLARHSAGGQVQIYSLIAASYLAFLVSLPVAAAIHLQVSTLALVAIFAALARLGLSSEQEGTGTVAWRRPSLLAYQTTRVTVMSKDAM